jgi:hypothetical protein
MSSKKNNKKTVTFKEGTEFHPGYYNFLGPGTHLINRLSLQKGDDKHLSLSIGDLIALEHDLGYSSESSIVREQFDEIFLQKLFEAQEQNKVSISDNFFGWGILPVRAIRNIKDIIQPIYKKAALSYASAKIFLRDFKDLVTRYPNIPFEIQEAKQMGGNMPEIGGIGFPPDPYAGQPRFLWTKYFGRNGIIRREYPRLYNILNDANPFGTLWQASGRFGRQQYQRAFYRFLFGASAILTGIGISYEGNLLQPVKELRNTINDIWYKSKTLAPMYKEKVDNLMTLYKDYLFTRGFFKEDGGLYNGLFIPYNKGDFDEKAAIEKYEKFFKELQNYYEFVNEQNEKDIYKIPELNRENINYLTKDYDIMEFAKNYQKINPEIIENVKPFNFENITKANDEDIDKYKKNVEQLYNIMSSNQEETIIRGLADDLLNYFVDQAIKAPEITKIIKKSKEMVDYPVTRVKAAIEMADKYFPKSTDYLKTKINEKLDMAKGSNNLEMFNRVYNAYRLWEKLANQADIEAKKADNLAEMETLYNTARDAKPKPTLEQKKIFMKVPRASRLTKLKYLQNKGYDRGDLVAMSEKKLRKTYKEEYQKSGPAMIGMSAEKPSEEPAKEPSEEPAKEPPKEPLFQETIRRPQEIQDKVNKLIKIGYDKEYLDELTDKGINDLYDVTPEAQEIKKGPFEPEPTVSTIAGVQPEKDKKFTLLPIKEDQSIQTKQGAEQLGERTDDYEGNIQLTAREELLKYVTEDDIIKSKQEELNEEEYLDLFVAKVDPENKKIDKENKKQELLFNTGNKDGNMVEWFATPNRNMLNDNKYLTEQTKEAYDSLTAYEPRTKSDFILNPQIPTTAETTPNASRSEQNNQYNNNVELYEPWNQTLNSQVGWQKYNKRLFGRM